MSLNRDPIEMNILIVSKEYPPETASGGIGTYVHQLAHTLADMGHHVEVITEGMQLRGSSMDGKVHVHRTYPPGKWVLRINRWTKNKFNNLMFAAKIYRRVRNTAVDIVETQNWDYPGIFLSLLKKQPVVTRLVTPLAEVLQTRIADPSRKSFNTIRILEVFWCWLEKISVLRSDALMTSSSAHAEYMRNIYGRKGLPIEVVPLGIKLPQMQEKARFPQNSSECLNILYVGRLEPRKGILALLKAIPEVVKHYPDVQFHIVGKDTFYGPGGTSYKSYCLQSLDAGYHKFVKFHGYLSNEDLQKAYKECDIFVAPSLYESFGLIYIEAMAYGKPVIGCRTGGVPEIVDHGRTGLLVPPEDHCKLADAVVSLCGNAQLREEMGRAARKEVERRFSSEKMAENTIEFYKTVIKEFIKSRKNSIYVKTKKSQFEEIEFCKIVDHVSDPSKPFEPKVSVIIPTYNRENPLCDTLRSALGQKYPNYEIIVVDQTKKHTAETESFLQSIGKRINYYKLETPSLPNARNYGMKKASGEIIIYIDDDVELSEAFIENHVKVYRNCSQIAGVAGGITGDGDFMRHSPPLPGFTKWGEFYGAFSTKRRGRCGTARGCNMSFRRDLLEAVGGFDVQYLASATREESDLCLRFRKKGYHIFFEPDAWLYHKELTEGGCKTDEKNIPRPQNWVTYHNEFYFFLKNFSWWRLPGYFVHVYSWYSGTIGQRLPLVMKGFFKACRSYSRL